MFPTKFHYLEIVLNSNFVSSTQTPEIFNYFLENLGGRNSCILERTYIIKKPKFVEKNANGWQVSARCKKII